MSFSSWSKTLAISIFFSLLCAASLAQSGSPKYDITKEVTIKGTVAEVRQPPNPSDPTSLVVKVGDTTTIVQLAPAGFLKDMDCWIKAGDQVEVKGAKISDTPDQILAREIDFGNNTMVLRDDKGVAIWEHWKPGKAGG